MSEATTDGGPAPGGPPLQVLLVSTYELGHQPFGLASPAAWLRATGADVRTVDLSVETVPEDVVRAADLIAFYLPMHTATRMAAPLVEQARAANPAAHLCAYGLYAPANAEMLRRRGVDSILGGEFEQPLRDLCIDLAAGRGASTLRSLPLISLGRQAFLRPDRSGMPELDRYAHLRMPDGTRRVTGYTEATRGCKHLCRHCPVVPVYGGRFRVIQDDVVAADIAELVAAGAEHITFGDPDFLNGPRHAVDVVGRLADAHPGLTYDVTIKVEHLVKHADLLPVLRSTGCILVTSAVESFDEQLLQIFDKRHTQADLLRAVQLLADVGIALNPTFVAFTPWTAAGDYVSFLSSIRRWGLVSTVAPVQYAVRLLIPSGSLLLDVPGIDQFVGEFDADRLCFDWRHPDPVMDQLQGELFAVTEEFADADLSRGAVFDRIVARTADVLGGAHADALRLLEPAASAHVDVPHLSEPWFCCSEPVHGQMTPLF